MKIDCEKWKAEATRIRAEITALKKKQRTPHRPEWKNGIDDWALARLKDAATLLYAIRARARGKVHAPKWEEHAEGRIAAGLAEYARKEEPLAPAAAAQ